MFSQRNERGAILDTSNLPFDEWTEVFGSERLTGALLDRLTHHVRILEMNGESYRLNQSRQRRDPSRRVNRPPCPRLTPWAHRALPRARPPRQPVEGTPRRALGPPMDCGGQARSRRWPLFTPPRWPHFTPLLTLSDLRRWADKHLVVAEGPRAGKPFKTGGPPWADVLDAMDDPELEQVTIRGSVQSGKTATLIAAALGRTMAAGAGRSAPWSPGSSPGGACAAMSRCGKPMQRSGRPSHARPPQGAAWKLPAMGKAARR